MKISEICQENNAKLRIPYILNFVLTLWFIDYFKIHFYFVRFASVYYLWNRKIMSTPLGWTQRQLKQGTYLAVYYLWNRKTMSTLLGCSNKDHPRAKATASLASITFSLLKKYFSYLRILHAVLIKFNTLKSILLPYPTVKERTKTTKIQV